MDQEIGEPEDLRRATGTRDDDIADAKLVHHLAARAAGHGSLAGPVGGRHGDGAKTAVPLGDGAVNRGTLSADRQAVGRILYVAARDDGS